MSNRLLISRLLSFSCALLFTANPVMAQQAFIVDSGSQTVNAGQIHGSSQVAVSAGATLIIDFSSQPSLLINGDLTNAGSILATTSNPGSISISAQNIYNSGLISSLTPGVDLSLSAAQNFQNLGQITSAGNLSLFAGNSLVNTGLVSAAQNLSAIVGSGGLTNSGLLQALNGSINVSNNLCKDLVINNSGGQMEALLGDINLSSTDFNSEKSNISLSGGDFNSGRLHLTTSGDANVAVDEISGRVDVDACALHLLADSQNVNLGSVNLSGDPYVYNSGDVTISGNQNYSAQNLAIVAGGNIVTSGGNWSIDTSANNLNAGSILMVAGAQFTYTPAPTDTITITGPSASGGNIDLTGGGTAPITTLSTAQTGANGSAGALTMVAYAVGANTGTITIPSNVNITTGTANNSVFSTNGNVTMIAGATNGTAIQTGSINSSGNIQSPSLNNGAVYIASGTPTMLSNPGNTSTATSVSTGTVSGATVISVNSAANLTSGNTYYLNAGGTTYEQVTISSISGNNVTLMTPLQYNHTASELFLSTAPSVVTQTSAGFAGQPILQNGGTFVAGTTQAGSISLQGITAGANVVVSTSPTAAGTDGTVTVNGAVSLTQNPTTQAAPAAFINAPGINITSTTLNIAGGGSLTSSIAGCPTCQDSINLVAQTFTNNGTISSNSMSASSPGVMTATNNGTITGTGSNPMLAIIAGGTLAFSGTGSFSTPGYSVVELAAADGNALALTSSHNFQTGAGSVVLLNGQGAGGTVNLSGNSSLTVGPGTLVSINTPDLALGNNSSITAGSGSNIVITSGAIAASPQPLTISPAASGTASLTATGGNIIFRPTDGQNLVFDSAGSTIQLSANNVYFFTCTDIATGATGTVTNSGVTFSGTSTTSVTNPNGGITGTAWEPYVGPATPAPPNFTLFSAYSYAQAILLLAPIVSTGLFQSVSTYTQGAFLTPGADASQISSYTMVGAAKYSIAAAKQIGLQISAGAYVENPDKSVNVPGTSAEINYALLQASKYGNVMDLVVGNECIVGGAAPQASTQVLIQAIQYAQNQRNSTTSFTSSTLPVTTRQTYGVLSGVSQFTSTVQLLNGCTGCPGATGVYSGVDGYVYANVYPYFDQPVINALAANPSITQSAFTTLVTNQIQADLNGTLQAFTGASITPKLRVGETGWATTSTPAGQAPQANLTWASWYYPAMQAWSATNSAASGYQIPINGYFEALDEPWKYTTTAGQGGEPNFGIWTATGTTTTTPSQVYTLTGITQKFPLPIYLPTQSSNSSAQNVTSFLRNAVAPQPTSVVAFTPPTVNIEPTINTPNANISSTILPTDVNPQTQPDNSSAFSSFTSLNSTFSLLGGHTLVAPSSDYKVTSPLADVSINAGAAALVLNTTDHLVIMALHDDSADSIQVTVNGQALTVPVGRQLIITRDGAAKNSNPSRFAKRNIQNVQIGNITAELSEFSLPSALNALNTLKMLRSESKDERRLAQKLVKTAAAMMTLSKDQTPYSAND